MGSLRITTKDNKAFSFQFSCNKTDQWLATSGRVVPMLCSLSSVSLTQAGKGELIQKGARKMLAADLCTSS